MRVCWFCYYYGCIIKFGLCGQIKVGDEGWGDEEREFVMRVKYVEVQCLVYVLF